MILISIGSNLPARSGRQPIDTCRQAVMALDSLPNIRLKGLSRWYETAPIPPSGQPRFINAVAQLGVGHGPSTDPSMLLAHLMAIEQAAGRRRSGPNAARILDLDIIAMGSLVRHTPDPILPHPRAHQRGFVLIPLRDVAPGWIHPALGLDVDTLIAALPPQDVRPLGGSV